MGKIDEILKEYSEEVKIIHPNSKVRIKREKRAEIANMLYLHAKHEVMLRSGGRIDMDWVKVHCADVADWFVGDDGRRVWLTLMGGCGNGKTTMLRAIRMMLLNTVAAYGDLRWIKAVDVAAWATDTPEYFESMLCSGKGCTWLLIDDLGEEATELKSYGNSTMPMIRLLSDRYDRQLPTIFTTNLSALSIGEKYGVRIADRFAEISKTLVFTENSYRKNV